MQPTSVRAFQARNASSPTRKLELRLVFHTSSLSCLFFIYFFFLNLKKISEFSAMVIIFAFTK